MQKTTWSYDRSVKQWYFHRFYDFQPDLNIVNPAVRDEMEKIIGFWLNLGIAGFRVDAVPFLIEPVSARAHVARPRVRVPARVPLATSRGASGDAVLLGEANVERDEITDYFGVGGMHMLFNFAANQQLWLALAREDARPARSTRCGQTAGIPGRDQWANFLRNNDEIDLGRLADDERRIVFHAFAPRSAMQLYDRGIRRRLAPMLGGDRRRIELAFAPAARAARHAGPLLRRRDRDGRRPVAEEREPVRTPMQWSSGPNAGFSRAPRRQCACRSSLAGRTGIGR